MPDGGEALTVRVVPRLKDVASEGWDACAGPENPFVSHAFLSALEESGSATREAGWLPQHLVLEGPGGRVLGAAPMYLKSHSLGEYVFDHAWADAFERAGGRYYPKLQICVPFTPVTGPRLLVRPGLGGQTGALEAALITAAEEVARRRAVSSIHVTFVSEREWRRFAEAGWLRRTDCQFHWQNRGYAGFDDFLGALAARKRKAVRRERREAARAGLTIRTLAGDDITEAHWDAFFRFYAALSGRKWGDPYLTRAFFSQLGANMAGRVVLFLAERDGAPVAGALNLLGADTLYGRYWGCLEDHRFLHFELCYYRAIDYAIAHDLKHVEAGAQGPHKIQRGYLPAPTFSAHWIADARLRSALADYLARERQAVAGELRALTARSPFRAGARQGDGDGGGDHDGDGGGDG